MTQNNPLKHVSVFASVVALSPGGHHVCALKADGSVVCWGDNSSGQLGNGSTQDSATPVAAAGLSHAVILSSGHRHSCALLADGTVACWGDNGYGQLGNGSKRDSAWPRVVPGLSGVAAVTAGRFTTCALRN
jgi:alpha-tubulin suppressor-like RCC1 family protein